MDNEETKSQEWYDTVTMERPQVDTKTIPVICSRCNTIFQLPKWLVKDGDSVAPSHGLCSKCHDEMLMEHERFLKGRGEAPPTVSRWKRLVGKISKSKSR